METPPPEQAIAAGYVLVLTILLIVDSIAHIVDNSIEINRKKADKPQGKHTTNPATLWWKRLSLIQPKFTCFPQIQTIQFVGLFLLNLILFIVPCAVNQSWSLDYVSNVFAWLGTGNLFFVFILITRNSILYYLINLPFERSLTWHIWIGWFIFVDFALHSILYFVDWTQYGQFLIQLKTDTNIYGLIGWICLVIFSITSLPWVRRKVFRVFFYSHFLFIPFVIFSCLHYPPMVYFLIGGLALYVLDRIIRFAKSRQPVEILDVTTFQGPISAGTLRKDDYLATITPAGEQGGCVKLVLKIPKNHTFEAGQYLFLCLPQISKTWILDWHPMTISSAPSNAIVPRRNSVTSPLTPFSSTAGLLDASGTPVNTLTLHIKAAGDWSKKLVKAASKLSSMDEEGLNAFKGASIDGYYGLTKLHWSRFSTVTLVSGGIGFTAMLSIGKDLVNRMLLSTGCSTLAYATKDLYMLQFCRSWEEYQYFRTECRELWDAVPALKRNGCRLVFRVFLTKPTLYLPGISDVERRNIHLAKPDVQELFADVDSRTERDVGVGVCGPLALVQDVRNACAKRMDKRASRAWDLHWEEFDF